MKRVAAACFLLLGAVAVTIWTDYMFANEMNMLEKELDTLITVADKIPEKQLLEKAEVIVSQWEKSSGLLRSIVLHDGIDELGRNITSLPQIVECSGKEEMKKMCIDAINMIKNLRECEMIRIENIL